ncbi:MAG: S41 family peptidase [Candidatus Cohnella colombiensis]|uniref:S41 family peptidase n=1 Tax=Candidatus Cohnella colombiensis TaxID=3121368 RepID=A0AA95EUY7_9BACL|nr:MAG: S41 family peptidase [Cohnella sp.]
MWFRGRTVLAFMVLTAIATGSIVYMVMSFPGLMSSSSEPRVSSPIVSGEQGFTQNEFNKLNRAFEFIRKQYYIDTKRSTLIDGAIQGMVESLDDPYSIYKTEAEAEAFTDVLQGAFTGIGAELTSENGAIVVQSAIRSSPADRAGLLSGDELLSVNGQSLLGLSLVDAATLIRGPKGTKAKLKVRRDGVSEPIDLELVRDRIDLETVHSERTDDGIGYIAINQFTFDTAEQVSIELKALEKLGIHALVIDVRDNPGGIVQSVEAVAELFIVKGKPIMQVAHRSGKTVIETADKGIAIAKPYPIIVLMNQGSASAAEILAGALKQSAGAILIGETTYGKGTVQVSNNEDLGDGSIIKLTVSKWLLPDGTWVNKIGIAPDIVVAQPEYFLASQLPRDKVLKYDTTGDAVRNLQLILAGVGFPADRQDGYFSIGTRIALKKFQNEQVLPESGEVTRDTAQRLEEMLYAVIHNPLKDEQLQVAYEQARALINE